VFVYRKKTKTLQKKIDRLRMTEFNSLVEGSAAWQNAGQAREIHHSQSAVLPLQTTKALTELLQDKFVERTCPAQAHCLTDLTAAPVAPEEHDPAAGPVREDAPHDTDAHSASNTNVHDEEFDPHCMLLGDVSACVPRSID
jgi:hypothetical protein